MQQLLEKYYSIKNALITPLDGYDNENYLVQEGNKQYILKVYDDLSLATQLTAENELLTFLEQKNGKAFPKPLPNRMGENLTWAESGSKTKLIRLLTFLKGKFLGDIPPSPSLFLSFWKFLARMDRQLQEYAHQSIAPGTMEWDLEYVQMLITPKVKYITNPDKRKLVEYFLLKHRTEVQPVLNTMRKQIIHNDANDRNVLVNDDTVTGLIDFGDNCFSSLIHEIAIALTYALMEKNDPLRWGSIILQGYSSVLPLEEKEIDALYWLIGARLCTSVCNSAEQHNRQPYNSYITSSEGPAWNMLRQWMEINPLKARDQFRTAAGIPVPETESTQQLLRSRHKNISSSLSVSYTHPVYIHSAAFQYMFDKYGHTYLDAYNNIPHVGHLHPRVVEAGQKQMARLNTNTRYLYDELQNYTEKLLGYFPAPLSKIFLVNSGSAATDLALRLARNYTGKDKIAALEYGYHGNTEAALEISHYKFSGPGGPGASGRVEVLPLPDTYSGLFSDEDAAQQYILQASEQLQKTQELAAFIAEPIVGCGGQIPLPQGYLSSLYEIVRNKNGLCISDEVQTGFGRLGDVFWGFEQHGVIPDIVILGKPMGNGHPLAAVVTTNPIAEAFDNGMEFFSSFGGNPVSCAIGQAVLEVMEQEELQKNAFETGNYYLEQLRNLQQNHPVIGDVRGSGLFVGIECTTASGLPDMKTAQWIKNEMRNRYILLSTDGPYNNVIKSKPPLCFQKSDADRVVQTLDVVLRP